jgi:hypothetical protein
MYGLKPIHITSVFCIKKRCLYHSLTAGNIIENVPCLHIKKKIADDVSYHDNMVIIHTTNNVFFSPSYEFTIFISYVTINKGASALHCVPSQKSTTCNRKKLINFLSCPS